MSNINYRNVQRKNGVNNIDRSSLRAHNKPWQNGPYKNKHIEQHNTRKTTMFVCCGFWILFLNFLKWNIQEMLSYRLGTVNDFHWRFKPVFHYSKPHIYSTLIGKEYKLNLKDTLTDRRVKGRQVQKNAAVLK